MMLSFLVLFFVIFLVAIELLSIKLSKHSVDVRCKVAMDLSQPGEDMLVTYEVRNRFFLPVLFCRLSYALPQNVTLSVDESWYESHTLGTYLSTQTVKCSMSLKGFGSKTDTLRIHADKRGVYDFGRCSVTTGDFLGIITNWEHFDTNACVVCTAKKVDFSGPDAISGARLGDVSVKRFLYDDPTLIMGFREYSGSEPMKQISWMQTAKTGRLCVKVNDFTAQPSVAIFLDMNPGDSTSREAALERLRAVCEALEVRKIQYSVTTNCEMGNLDSGYGEKHLHRILTLIGRTSSVPLYDSEFIALKMKKVPQECFKLLISSENSMVQEEGLV